MFIEEKYKIRHKILEALQTRNSQLKGNGNPQIEEIELTLEEMSDQLNIPIESIHKNTGYLSEIGEIYLNRDKDQLKFCITKKGIISFYDKTHIIKGRKEFWNNTYDIVKTISAIIFLIIALFTVILNIIDTRQNKREIDSLKNDLYQYRGNK